MVYLNKKYKNKYRLVFHMFELCLPKLNILYDIYANLKAYLDEADKSIFQFLFNVSWNTPTPCKGIEYGTYVSGQLSLILELCH